jgi:hypothetical protein
VIRLVLRDLMDMSCREEVWAAKLGALAELVERHFRRRTRCVPRRAGEDRPVPPAGVGGPIPAVRIVAGSGRGGAATHELPFFRWVWRMISQDCVKWRRASDGGWGHSTASPGIPSTGYVRKQSLLACGISPGRYYVDA